jgi:hypothetical protein
VERTAVYEYHEGWETFISVMLNLLTISILLLDQCTTNEFHRTKPNMYGRAMAQAVSRRSPTVEFRVSPCGICGGQSGTRTGFFAEYFGFPVNFIPPVLHYLEK